MQITFCAPGLAYSIDSILLFQTEETGNWWRDSLYCFYPQLDRTRMEQTAKPEQEAYLREALSDIYQQAAREIVEKKEAYQAHWEENRQAVEDVLGNIFRMPLAGRFQNVQANITLRAYP